MIESRSNEHFIKNGIEHDVPLSDAIFRYTQIRNSPKYKSVIFVEGFDDPLFYKNMSKKLTGNSYSDPFFIHNGRNGGKKKVIQMYQYCKTHLPIFRDKVLHFIVDHDYECKALDALSTLDISCFTILPVYSIENYYFEDNNLEIILSHIIPGSDEQSKISRFLPPYSAFLYVICDYCSHKKVSVELDEKKYSISKQLEELILSVDFANPQLYDKKTLRNIHQKLSNWFIKLPSVSAAMIPIYKQAMSKNTALLQGKILLQFLIKYLLHELRNKNSLTGFTDDSIKKELFSLSGIMHINLVMGKGLR